MLSKKCKYAIHALVHMARKPNEKFLIRNISEQCNIPKKFLETILLELKHAGIVGSKQGKGGGYTLRASPAEVNLTDIIRLFDGAIAAIPCASLKFYAPCDDCVDEAACAVRHSFLVIRDSTLELMKAQTLEHLVRTENKLQIRKA
jgi:Rrf2 family protein